MGQASKHIAVRLWISFISGSLIALLVLPLPARSMGPDFMVIPALLFIAISYWATGFVLKRMGLRQLNLLMNEAAVWERAGMAREARNALFQAESTLDSFFFSPFSRKNPAEKLLAQIARFQLTQAYPESSSEIVVGSYLRLFPSDREAAVKWLERVLAGRSITKQSHDIASRIGSAHGDDFDIQGMLARFYVSEDCLDFTALTTFRYLIESRKKMGDDLLLGIVDLFLSHRRADKLALEAYIMGHAKGRGGERLLEGIAACRHVILPTPLTQPLLDMADAVLEGTSPRQQAAMMARFIPENNGGEAAPKVREKRMPRISLRAMAKKGWILSAESTGKLFSLILVAGSRTRSLLSSRSVRKAFKWGALGVFGLCVGWLAVTTVLHLAEGLKPLPQIAEPETIQIGDPFTLQVAAYLKADDARRYVDQLKDNGLDAYLVQATANNRVWFQVRVSHFKTKADARSMGETLKKRKLIDDFYVTNYTRTDMQ